VNCSEGASDVLHTTRLAKILEVTLETCPAVQAFGNSPEVGAITVLIRVPCHSRCGKMKNTCL
jgi:hypothetical protein